MISRDEVLRLVEMKGPLMPSDINSQLKENTFIVGAFLSELVASKKLLITRAKIGGSPLYYLDKQKAGITKLYPYLNEKDRITFDLLQKELALYDDEQTPLIRTSLRNLPDFAYPAKIVYKENQLVFWRWFISSEEDFKVKVRGILQRLFPEETPKVSSVVPEELSLVPEVEKEGSIQKENNVLVVEKEVKKEIQVEKPLSVTQEKSSQSQSSNKTLNQTTTSNFPPLPKEKTDTQISLKTVDENLDTLPTDDFLQQIKDFLHTKNILITHAEVLKKDKEIDLLLKVPSPVGDIVYFCKAKNKKRINEGDVSTAYVEGQNKGFPVLFLSFSDISKKMEETISSKYKTVKVLKI